jgi:hypothetical protein
LIVINAALALTVAAGQPARHLFLDPAFVQQATNVSLHVNPPQRREAVITHDKPWEQLMITLFLTVRDENGKLRMWYICRDKANHPNVAYAESTDGVYWTKPNLGIVEYNGSTSNNLVGIHSLEGDCGYPSSVQRADDKIVTAYYSKGAENHERYHMGVAIWQPPAK